jgi:hypothetical protein
MTVLLLASTIFVPVPTADFNVRAYGDYSTVLNGYRLGFRLFRVERNYVGVKYYKRSDWHNH